MKNWKNKWNIRRFMEGDSQKDVKKKIDNLIFILMIFCYGMAIFSMVRPIEWRVGKDVQEDVSAQIAMTKDSKIKYKMPVSSTRLDEIQFYLKCSSIQGLSGNLNIDFYPEDVMVEKIHNEVDLREWQNNENNVYIWDIGDIPVQSETYILEFYLENVKKEIRSDKEILYLGIEENAKYDQGELEADGVQSGDKVKLAVETGGYKEETTFAFDFLLLAGVLLLAYVLFAEGNGGVKDEKKST